MTNSQLVTIGGLPPGATSRNSTVEHLATHLVRSKSLHHNASRFLRPNTLGTASRFLSIFRCGTTHSSIQFAYYRREFDKSDGSSKQYAIRKG
jgi:hypothetical protein